MCGPMPCCLVVAVLLRVSDVAPGSSEWRKAEKERGRWGRGVERPSRGQVISAREDTGGMEGGSEGEGVSCTKIYSNCYARLGVRENGEVEESKRYHRSRRARQ